MQEKDLASAVELPLDGIADYPFVILGHDGFHRQPIMRRRLDRAHVPGAGEGEVKRARDGRGAQRQDIHQLAQHLEFFFVHDAEPLLLVDDHQAQIFEGDVALQQSMCADHNVDGACGQVFRPRFCCAAAVRNRESNSTRTG